MEGYSARHLAVLSMAAVLLLLILVLTSGAAARLPAMFSALFHGDLVVLRHQLRSLGAAGVATLVVLVLAHTILPFPAEPLEAAAGFALGLAVALPVLEASLIVSAIFGYLIGARLGRPVARTLAGSARLDRAERLVARGGTRMLLGVRLIPLLPFTPVCVACGLTRVQLRRYTWTTAVGILPEMTLVVFIGARLRSFSLSDPLIWVPLAGMFLLLVVGPTLLRSGQRSDGES